MKSVLHQHLSACACPHADRLAQRIFLTIIILKRLAYLLSKTDKGRLIKDPNSITTSYAYDTLSRLLSIAFKNTTGATIGQFAYAYDNISNKLTATDPAENHQYQYDTIYRLTNARHTAVPNEAYTYDAAGRKTDAYYPNTLVNSYLYDNSGRLIFNPLKDASE